MRPSGVVVCDLDGTLVDIRVRDYSAYAEAARATGFVPLAIDDFWTARRDGAKIREFVSAELADAVADAFVELVESDAMLDCDQMFDDAPAFVQVCRARGRRVVVCTLRRRPAGVERQLDQLGLRALVDEVRVVSPAFHDKADVLVRYGGDVIMIGDTEADIRSARRAGVRAFAVTTGLRSRAFLERHAPDVLADSLHELLEPVLRIGAPGGE